MKSVRTRASPGSASRALGAPRGGPPPTSLAVARLARPRPAAAPLSLVSIEIREANVVY